MGGGSGGLAPTRLATRTLMVFRCRPAGEGGGSRGIRDGSELKEGGCVGAQSCSLNESTFQNGAPIASGVKLWSGSGVRGSHQSREGRCVAGSGGTPWRGRWHTPGGGRAPLHRGGPSNGRKPKSSSSSSSPTYYPPPWEVGCSRFGEDRLRFKPPGGEGPGRDPFTHGRGGGG